MKTSSYVLCAWLAMSSASVSAHVDGHDQQPVRVARCKAAACTKEEVTQGGVSFIAKFANNGKLDKSWKEVKTASDAKKNDGVWIVAYKNPKEPDKNKQTFYLYVTQDGLFDDANFTGK